MYEPYSSRPTHFLDVETVGDYRLKVYSITHGSQTFQRHDFAEGWNQAMAELPTPAEAEGRPAVGFVILHQGKTGHYLILCWWDRENELPTRVFIRDESGWRAARGGESFCVWDLKVMWREREAYVRTVLAGKSVDEYLKLAE